MKQYNKRASVILLATNTTVPDGSQDLTATGEAGEAPVTTNEAVGKSYMETYVRLAEYTRTAKPNEDGTPGRATETSVLPESRAKKRIEEAQKAIAEGKMDADLLPTVEVGQSCLIFEAKAIDELLPLCTANGKEDQAEQIALKHFNRGAVLVQQQEIRGLLEDPKFEPQEGVMSLAYAIAQKSESRAKTPEEKAAKALQALPQFAGQSLDEIQQLLAMFAAQRGAQPVG